MPSRRRFVYSAGTAVAAGGLAGCLSDLGLAKTGHLQLKAVSLRWSHDGRSYEDQLLDLRFDRDDGVVSGRYDPNFVGDSVRAPDDVSVSEAVHDRLARRFDVRYAIGVCGSDFAREGESDGCRNTWTSREEFNRVQLNDRAEVRLSDHSFDVIDVYEDAHAVESADVRTFDFAERHADDGVRSEDW
jgi:hypothetical protein